MYVCVCSVIKQALKASGANCTERHMEEVSMCGLSLLESAKKADKEFQALPRYSHHTVRSAEDDVEKMARHLMLENVTEQCPDRGSDTVKFVEPLELGMEKIVHGWIKSYLQSTEEEDTHTATDEHTDYDNMVELDYNLHDIV